MAQWKITQTCWFLTANSVLQPTLKILDFNPQISLVKLDEPPWTCTTSVVLLDSHTHFHFPLSDTNSQKEANISLCFRDINSAGKKLKYLETSASYSSDPSSFASASSTPTPPLKAAEESARHSLKRRRSSKP
jgi:hypothetical protein